MGIFPELIHCNGVSLCEGDSRFSLRAEQNGNDRDQLNEEPHFEATANKEKQHHQNWRENQEGGLHELRGVFPFVTHNGQDRDHHR